MAAALIPYLYSLSFNPIKLALVQVGTQLLQFSFLPSVPQPIGYTVFCFTSLAVKSKIVISAVLVRYL